MVFQVVQIISLLSYHRQTLECDPVCQISMHTATTLRQLSRALLCYKHATAAAAELQGTVAGSSTRPTPPYVCSASAPRCGRNEQAIIKSLHVWAMSRQTTGCTAQMPLGCLTCIASLACQSFHPHIRQHLTPVPCLRVVSVHGHILGQAADCLVHTA